MKINLPILSFVFVVFSMPFIAVAEVMPLGTQGIFITSISSATVCAGDNIDVDFNCSGFTPTGTLSVELSDAAGSFASPVVIATGAASNSGTITATVPTNTPQGSGYRLRVTSSAPVFMGSPNGVAITVNPLPQPVITSSAGPLCAGQCILLSATPSGGTFSAQGSLNGNIFCPINTGTNIIIYIYTDQNGCSVTVSQDIEVNPLPEPVITPSGSTSFCDGDSVMLQANFGYDTYQWHVNGLNFPPSTDSSFVADGEDGDCYTVEVTDANGCTGISNTICITVLPLPEPAITYTGSTTFCEGDSVILDVDPIYLSYLWLQNGVTPVGTGPELPVYGDDQDCYLVYVTNAEGCVGYAEEVCITVLPVTVPIITAVGPLVVCDGECVTLSADPGYNCYLWSTGETVQSIMACDSATYSLQVCGVNGCNPELVSVPVTIYPPVNPVIVPDGPTTFCEGECVNLALPGQYSNFQWSTGSTNWTLSVCDSGNYEVLVLDLHGCIDSTEIDITVYPAPNPEITVNGSTLSTTPFVSYQWNYNGVPISTGGTNQSYPDAIECGNYTVTVTDANGCTATSDTVYCPLSVGELTANDLRIYPNPATSTINIEQVAGGQFSFVKIINAVGEVVYDGSIINQQSNINIADFSSGIYFISLSGGIKQVSTRFVKE